MNNASKVLFFFVISAMIWSCNRIECDDPVPSIEYNSFSRYSPDTFQLVYDFIDCDGDIGLEADDDSPPFDSESDYYYNFFVDLYYMENGEWKLFDFGEGAPGLNDRIRRIVPEERDKPLEGEIQKLIDVSTFHPDHDTVKFRAVLVDRELNESSPAESEQIILSQLQ